MQKTGQPPEGVAAMEAKLRSTNLGAAGAQNPAAQARQPARQGYGQHSAAVADAARKKLSRSSKAPFELSLSNATLLEKRGRRNQPVI